MKNLKNKQGGFTLIEILVVIGIIAVLAAVVLIAINPARQFAQARNSQRSANTNAILNAIGQNMADHQGVFSCDEDDNGEFEAFPLPTDPDEIISSANADADIAPCLVPDYMPALPFEPLGVDTEDEVTEWEDEDTYNTGYTVEVIEGGRVQVCAPMATTETAIEDAPETICVTR